MNLTSKRLWFLTLSALIIFFLFSQLNQHNEMITVRLGVVKGYNDYWYTVKECVKEKGIDLKLVKFDDPALLNRALSEGTVDMNSFQNYAFLNNEVMEKGYRLTPICNTVIFPFGIYSNTVDDIKSFKENNKIAIPNDTVNVGRSLKLLESAGLIKLNPEKDFLCDISDITVNPLHLEFVKIEASQTASLLKDYSAAVIDSSNAINAELNPIRDSIYFEQVVKDTINPYINILVVRTEDKDNETYKIIAKAVNTPKIAKRIKYIYDGELLPAF